MKTTLSWLKEHLETEASTADIARQLTALGLEVESIEDPARDLAPFTVGYVVEAKQHPNADRLRVCLVDTGSGQVQVVCGAPNARTGMKGVFAAVGSRIPGTGLELKAGVIRGVESNGMLCSKREMGLGEDHDGIIELPDDAPVGAPFAQVMGLDDPLIDLKVTPDRADCLGVAGIARDLSAGGLGLPAGRRALFPRPQERPLPALAAGPADGDRASADLRSGRHHELRHLRSQPDAACVRCGQARGRSHHAAGPRGRDDPGPRRSDL